MEGEQQSLFETITNTIREESRKARLCHQSELPGLLRESALGGEIEKPDEAVEQFIASLEEESEIRLRRGAQESYLYSSEHMADAYADILTNIEEQDLPKLIADQVRRDSRRYPRPTDKRLFSQPPFGLSDEALDTALEQMAGSEEYQDIRSCAASNAAEYLYSNKFLSDDHARHLTEWYEVEEEMNP